MVLAELVADAKNTGVYDVFRDYAKATAVGAHPYLFIATTFAKTILGPVSTAPTGQPRQLALK